MHITLLGLLTVPLTVIAVARPGLVPYLLAGTMPLIQSSAVEFGTSHVQPFYVAAFAPAILLVLPSRSGRSSTEVGGIAAFAGLYCAATAIFLPHLFAGAAVLVPRGGVDEQVSDPGKLMWSISNAAQAIYLLLAIAVLVYIAKNPPARSSFLLFGIGFGTLLNVWALAGQYGIPFPRQIFTPTTLIDQRYQSYFENTARFDGIYAEPSVLAVFALGCTAYALSVAFSGTSNRRTALIIVATNMVMLGLSYSGTAVAGAAGIAAVAAVIFARQFLAGNLKVSAGMMIGLITVAVGLTLLSPLIYNFASNIVSQKLDTNSYSDREGSNGFSWHLFVNTYTLGVGLGSNRPSSFLLALLSTVGLIGTLLLGALAWRVVRAALTVGQYKPELWCLATVLIAKSIAEPNLNHPLMWMSLAACAPAASQARRSRTQQCEVAEDYGLPHLPPA